MSSKPTKPIVSEMRRVKKDMAIAVRYFEKHGHVDFLYGAWEPVEPFLILTDLYQVDEFGSSLGTFEVQRILYQGKVLYALGDISELSEVCPGSELDVE